MKINGTNYLTLEKRGCNFWKDAPEREYSNVGNYRVFTEFTDKNGVEVCGDFGGYDVRDYTKKSKPVTRKNALHRDLQYTNSDGMTYCYNAGNAENYSYTLEGILEFVNSIAAETYEKIKFIHTFEFVQESGGNFTPAHKMVEWAKAHRLEWFNEYGNTIIKLYSGNYKYLCYKIEQMKNGKEKVKIYMEEV